MIKLASEVTIPTSKSVKNYNVRLKIVNMAINDDFRLLEPTIENSSSDMVSAYAAKLLEIDAKLNDISLLSVNSTLRPKYMADLQLLEVQKNGLMFRDEGVVNCSIRYEAIEVGDTNAMKLPINGLMESYTMYLSDLLVYPSNEVNAFTATKERMKQAIVSELVVQTFMGFGERSDYIIE